MAPTEQLVLVALVYSCIVLQIHSSNVAMELSGVDCKFSHSTTNTGSVIETEVQIEKAECIAKCFLSAECSQVAYDEETQKCTLLKEGSNLVSPALGQLFGNIQCDARSSSGETVLKREATEEIARWDFAGVCCGTVRHGSKLPGHPKRLAEAKHFSQELCFVNCKLLNCTALEYHKNTQKCELYGQRDICDISTFPDPHTDHFCQIQCFDGRDLPADVCNPTTLSTRSSMTSTTSPMTSTTSPMSTTTSPMTPTTSPMTPTTSPITSTTSPMSTTTSNETTTSFTGSTTSPVSTTTPPPCQQDCLDPCNLKVETMDGKNLTTTVCKHGKCTSTYIGNNQYTFKCDCYSPSDKPPFCTPGCGGDAEGVLLL